MKLPVIRTTGRNSSVTVNQGIFAAPVNQQILAQAVRVYQLNQRQGTAHTKNRKEVVRTKSKWYRQKGTGRARQALDLAVSPV
jgi:large subunit ribosomal protein L4